MWRRKPAEKAHRANAASLAPGDEKSKKTKQKKKTWRWQRQRSALYAQNTSWRSFWRWRCM
jgi:hypothetical protein